MAVINNKKPIHLLAGGPRQHRKAPDPLIRESLQESGIASSVVAYVGVASDDDRGFFNFIASSLVEAGAGAVDHVPISPKKADIERTKTILESADVVFISGGDVEHGMSVLVEKGLVDFLSGLYQRGKPFFGISAGAIMLAERWVRWPDENDEASAELFPCLGFASVICDTHDEVEGWRELQAALLLCENDIIGYGIALGTALKVFPNGDVAARGGPVSRFVKRAGKVLRIEDILPED